MIGTDNLSARRGTSANKPTICRSAASASKAPRWPPASSPWATTASAPAASAARASARVVAQANQAMPRAFSSATKASGKSPMIDETIRGAAASRAAHCAAKSSGAASPASCVTGGPHCPRNSRTSRSRSASRSGGGSGTHRLIWNVPLLCPRNSRAQAAMPSGAVISAPSPPIPPALPTAAASPTGQAPAIGACRIGTRKPKRRQNSSARRRGSLSDGILRLALPDIEIHRDRIAAAEQPADVLARARRVPAGPKRREARGTPRLDDEPQCLPKGFLRLPDRIVGHEHDPLDKLLGDRKDQLSDTARRERIGCY